MTNRNIIIAAVLSGAVITGAVIAVACSALETPDKIDLASTYTTVAASSEPEPESTAAPATAPETSGQADGAGEQAESITYEIQTHKEGNISVQYPVLSNISDPAKQEQVNQLLKKNALSILDAWDAGSGKTSIEIKCQVPSVTRKRATALYTGSAFTEGTAHPTNIFYSNTVDLDACKDLGLSDYTDPYTMAGYVLSDDVQFSGLGGEALSMVMEERKLTDINGYTKIFEEADFPLAASPAWPSSFSYEKQGEIYFSIPVSHAAGDYAIVQFTPETK